MFLLLPLARDPSRSAYQSEAEPEADYRSEAGAKLTWFDRQGKTLGTPSDAGYNAASLALSPDGSQAAAVRAEGNGLDICLADLVQGGRRRNAFQVRQG